MIIAYLNMLLSVAAWQRMVQPQMGLQVRIHIRGKAGSGEPWVPQAYDEYAKRLRPVLQLSTVWHKTDADMEAAVAKEACPLVALDEYGAQMTSPAFSNYLYSKLDAGGSRLAFVIGGAEGLPASIKADKSVDKLSLSKVIKLCVDMFCECLCKI
jgi:23S rRNA (pseudouridine1915-N3)-methyltransferase